MLGSLVDLVRSMPRHKDKRTGDVIAIVCRSLLPSVLQRVEAIRTAQLNLNLAEHLQDLPWDNALLAQDVKAEMVAAVERMSAKLTGAIAWGIGVSPTWSTSGDERIRANAGRALEVVSEVYEKGRIFGAGQVVVPHGLTVTTRRRSALVRARISIRRKCKVQLRSSRRSGRCWSSNHAVSQWTTSWKRSRSRRRHSGKRKALHQLAQTGRSRDRSTISSTTRYWMSPAARAGAPVPSPVNSAPIAALRGSGDRRLRSSAAATTPNGRVRANG